MVTVALASDHRGKLQWSGLHSPPGVRSHSGGHCLYRIIIAVAISTSIVPTEGFKLVSALVAVAIAREKLMRCSVRKAGLPEERGRSPVC